MALIPALMISFLISRKSFLFLVALKKQAKKPQILSLLPQEPLQAYALSKFYLALHSQTGLAKQLLLTVPTLPMPSSKRYQGSGKAAQAAHCLPFPCRKPLEFHENLTPVYQHSAFTQLPRDYPVLRTTRSHHPTSLAVKSCISELETPSEPIHFQALPNRESAARQKFCLQVAYFQVPTAGFL